MIDFFRIFSISTVAGSKDLSPNIGDKSRSAEDINNVRDVLGPRGANIKVIAKIDNFKALQNYEEILEASDGIIIARGHL